MTKQPKITYRNFNVSGDKAHTLKLCNQLTQCAPLASSANLTKKIRVGSCFIGGKSDIVVQSMTNTLTTDVAATVAQIKQLEKAGCELVRCSVPDIESARAVQKIKQKISIPLIADVHFDYQCAMTALDSGADKIRINPGNMRKSEVMEVVRKARDMGVAIRIGVNSGSLPASIVSPQKKLSDFATRRATALNPTYRTASYRAGCREEVHGSDDRAQSMVDKVEEYINSFEQVKFSNIVVSLKASDVLTTIAAYKKFYQRFAYPTHIGITESGSLFSGTIKSSAGLGILLFHGIGDTIRVSLTADPVWEVRAGFLLLQSLGLRKKYPEIISCPTCARTTIDVIKLTQQTEEFVYSLDWSKGKSCPLRIAIMGCVVNGPGEAKEADIGVCGAGKTMCVFSKGKIVKRCAYSGKAVKTEFFDRIKKIKKQIFRSRG